MALDEPAGTRQPGEFQRHPRTGAPYVNHPTEVTQKGKPRRVMYGRPSSLGKQIENATNLQKWAERAVALGMYLQDPMALNVLSEFDLNKLNLDDPDARPILDTLAAEAKRAAQANLAAERGTHTHELTEDRDEERSWITRAEAGEDLGIPKAAQQALVTAWERMLEVEGFEILAVEATVVDDRWNQAGTLDRIARLTRDRLFTMPDGRQVLLLKGDVVVLDLKTGKLRLDPAGHPQYWHGYAVQVASYAQSVPYDPDTDTRGDWGYQINQDYAIIAHLDVLGALEEGEARCRLICVDLRAGRFAGDLCVQAKQWEKRRDVFSTIDGTYVPVPVTEFVEPAADDLDRRQQLRERRRRMASNANDTGWGPQFEAEWATHGITPESSNDEIEAALDAIEPPFDVVTEPVPVEPTTSEPVKFTFDDGDILDAATLDTLLAKIKASPARSIVNGWLKESADVDMSWSPRVTGRVRQFEISRAALRLAEATDGDPTCVRLMFDAVNGAPINPTGAALAVLSIEEACRLTRLAEAFGDRIHLVYSEDGVARLDGDVAAVLAAT